MDTPRFSTDYQKLKAHLDFLSVEDLCNIEIRAKVLSFDDCLVWLGYTANEIPDMELGWAKKAHAKGAVEAVHEAAKHLFTNMKTRNGAQAALEYLKAKSGDFRVDATPTGNGSGFSFNVTMGDQAKKSSPLKAVS